MKSISIVGGGLEEGGSKDLKIYLLFTFGHLVIILNPSSLALLASLPWTEMAIFTAQSTVQSLTSLTANESICTANVDWGSHG